jgi:hypothetical protein
MEKRNAYRLLVGKPGGRRTPGRPRHRWVDNFKMDLAEMGLSNVDWIDLAQDRDKCRSLVNAVMNPQFPYTVAELSSGYRTCGFSCSAQLHKVNQSVNRSV